jgi:hypothetical protein
MQQQEENELLGAGTTTATMTVTTVTVCVRRVVSRSRCGGENKYDVVLQMISCSTFDAT